MKLYDYLIPGAPKRLQREPGTVKPKMELMVHRDAVLGWLNNDCILKCLRQVIALSAPQKSRSGSLRMQKPPFALKASGKMCVAAGSLVPAKTQACPSRTLARSLPLLSLSSVGSGAPESNIGVVGFAAGSA